MKKLPLLMFILLSIGFAIMLLRRETPNEIGSRDSKPFPAINVTSIDGKKTWEDAALRGRVTVINFFASWCTPCATEMPELVALKKQFPNLAMEGIVWNDDPKKLSAWLKKHGNPFDRIWLDPKGTATIDLGIKGIPESFIIDASGTIRYHLAGPLNSTLRSDTIAPLIASLQPERTTQNWQKIPLLLTSHARAEEVHQPIKAPEVQTLEEIGYQPKEARHADKKNASSNKDAEKADKERLRRLKSPMLVGAKNQRARRHR